jgi:Acetyltransferase (GNAT) domain
MVYVIDPLGDPRWNDFVERSDSSSIFHTPAWLEALRRTYGYTPVVYTTTPPSSPLSNGVALCTINSWLTGRRMVSVPFSDHCQPLLDTLEAAREIFESLRQSVEAGKWRYVELRPTGKLTDAMGAVECDPFLLHILDLSPSSDALFKGLHKDCVQRKVRRAEREQLEYHSGNSPHLLEAFYRLMVQTRRKHQLPPQPIEWFRNLANCMGERLSFKVAFKDGKEVAGIVTLQHRNVLVYKYGASDPEQQNSGGTPLVFWRTISEAKEAGLASLDLGRSDLDNPGLITFKDRLGAKSHSLSYQRWLHKPVAAGSKRSQPQFMKRLFAIMPDSILRTTGRLLYRHVG